MHKTCCTLIIFVSLLILSCGSKKTTIWKGQRVTLEIATKQSLLESETIYKNGDKERAKIEFEKFLRTFPENDSTDDVYYYLGRIAFESKNFDQAITVLTKFQTTYQKSTRVTEALFFLGLSYKNRGEFETSNTILIPLASSNLDRKEMLTLYQAVANNFEMLKKFRNSLTWLLKEYLAQEKGPEKEKLKEKIVSFIDERMSLKDLRELIEFAGAEFPAPYYYAKLIKYFYHTLEYENALDLAQEFLNKFPLHPYAKEIQTIFQNLTKSQGVKPKKIGCLLPLTGKFASYGNDVLQGILLASGIFSDAEGTIELEIRDTGDDSQQAEDMLRELYNEEQVIEVIGPLTQETAVSTAIAAQTLNLPIITLSQKEHITNIGDYVFRNFITKSNQVEKLVRFARFHMGIKNFAILYPDHPYGKEFANLFWDSVSKYGGSITAVESYDKDQKDFTKELKKLAGTYYTDARRNEICDTTDRFQNKIKGLNCFSEDMLPPKFEFEALFIPDTYQTVSLIAPALSFYDITGIQLMGINSLNHPDFIPRSGEENIQGILFTDTFFSESTHNELREFLKLYQTIYGKDPNLFAALGYDTMNIIKQVLATNKPATRRAFKEALHTIQGYKGVTGTTSFSENNDADKDLFLLSVDNGKIVEVN